jgi:hypothetical protein
MNTTFSKTKVVTFAVLFTILLNFFISLYYIQLNTIINEKKTKKQEKIIETETDLLLNGIVHYDQRLASDLIRMRSLNDDVDYFHCDIDNAAWDFINMSLNVIVLNTYRQVNTSSYLFKTESDYNVIVLNTTSAAKTNDWTRNCQQAHTQVLDSFFSENIDYLLILEDDIFVNTNITEKQYKNLLKCAVHSRVHFLFLMNLNIYSRKYWYGMQAYLMSRLSYFDFFRNSCFGVNSPLPIDGCLNANFNLLATKYNFVNHIFRSPNSTRNSFKLDKGIPADLTQIVSVKFDKPMYQSHASRLIK